MERLCLVACIGLLFYIALPASFAADAGVSESKTTTSDFVVPPQVPKDTEGAIKAAKDALENAKARRWFAFSAGIIWLVVFFVKVLRDNLKVMSAMPRRILWLIVPILSVMAMVFAKLQDDLSWSNALMVFFSGPCVAFMNDFFKRGVFGKVPTPEG